MKVGLGLGCATVQAVKGASFLCPKNLYKNVFLTIFLSWTFDPAFEI